MNDSIERTDAPAIDDASESVGAASEPVDEASIDELKRERDEYYDRLLRVTAEFDNYRKRNERERREMIERAAVGLIEQLLPIVDDFERAVHAEAGPDVESYREGVALILRQLLDLLARRGVTPIEALGADFDPHLHQAVAYEPSPGHRDGEVIEELRRGYKLGDRLLRPAMVKVARA